MGMRKSSNSKTVLFLYGVAFVLAIVTSILLIAATAIASEYQSNFTYIPAVENGPARVATWKRTPTVIVCEHAPVNEAQIKKAVKLWTDLDHKFFKTQYKYDPLNKCISKAPQGYIIIHLVSSDVKMDDSDLAETHFYVNNDTKEVDWAIIYMRATIKETVLEHELGHALGYLHYNKLDHLMNSKWMYGGWDKSGLANKRR